MNKKIKKICAMALGLAIAASSAMSVSASDVTVERGFANYTIIDDKGMEIYDGGVWEGYKVLCAGKQLYRAEPQFGYAKFILSENVDYEEVNERIIEIFKEFYPDNYLGVSSKEDDYYKNYKPNLWAETEDNVTTYTLCVNTFARCSHDFKVLSAKRYSKAFMKKLNEEKLISEFYDFGEVYTVTESEGNSITYHNLEAENVDLINNCIKEKNINCTLEKKAYSDGDGYYYKLKSNDGSLLKEFLAAVDIYEATSIYISYLNTWDIGGFTIYGKNALEEISDVTTSKEVKLVGDANGDNEITIKDCMFIARKLANREGADLPDSADYNKDGKKNIKDAATLAIDIAKRNIG